MDPCVTINYQAISANSFVTLPSGRYHLLKIYSWDTTIIAKARELRWASLDPVTDQSVYEEGDKVWIDLSQTSHRFFCTGVGTRFLLSFEEK